MQYICKYKYVNYYGCNRETRDSLDIKRASVLVQKHFTSGRGFEAKDLFIVTWDDVGFFDRGNDKVLRGVAKIVVAGRVIWTNACILCTGQHFPACDCYGRPRFLRFIRLPRQRHSMDPRSRQKSKPAGRQSSNWIRFRRWPILPPQRIRVGSSRQLEQVITSFCLFTLSHPIELE